MSDDDLVRRLRAVEEYGRHDLLTDGRPERLRNFDGPDAADAIERLTADNAILSKWHLDAEARADAAERKVEKLREALTEAADAIAFWGEYFSDYLREKHDLMGDIARARAALAETEKGDE